MVIISWFGKKNGGKWPCSNRKRQTIPPTNHLKAKQFYSQDSVKC